MRRIFYLSLVLAAVITCAGCLYPSGVPAGIRDFSQFEEFEYIEGGLRGGPEVSLLLRREVDGNYRLLIPAPGGPPFDGSVNRYLTETEVADAQALFRRTEVRVSQSLCDGSTASLRWDHVTLANGPDGCGPLGFVVPWVNTGGEIERWARSLAGVN